MKNIRVLIGLSCLSASIGTATAYDVSHRVIDNAFSGINIILEPATPAPPRIVDVDLETIAGMKIGNLNSWYVGINGKLPRTAKIDFDQNMKKLWQKKLAIKGVTPATKKSADMIVERYIGSERSTMTATQFVNEADREVHGAWSNIDFTRLCAHYHLDGNKCILLRDITGKINGRDLVAYGMTEMFPAQNGDINLKMLNVILKSAGVNYLNSIPSFGDRLLSMGFYQFTSNAVRHDATNIDGASAINLYAGKGHRIGGSVITLTRQEQHRAAFYFATYNIMRLVKALNPKQQATLKKMMPMREHDLATFIAVSHHLPTGAIAHTQAWLQEGAKRPMSDYFGSELKLYAKKTDTNLDALKGIRVDWRTHS